MDDLKSKERNATTALLPVRRRERESGSLTRLHNEVDDLFRSFFEDWDIPVLHRSRWPAVDIAENENEFLMKAEVPGCKADDIDISVHGNTLTISGEKDVEEEKKDKGYYYIERSHGSVRRSLNLSADIDAEKIEATCKGWHTDSDSAKE